MPTIKLSITIRAPIERVFDLARSIDAHTHSTRATSERAVGGVTAGLIGLGEEVEWEARHFGVMARLLVRVTAFQRPHHFQDVMLKGAFARMQHDHYFREVDGFTEMNDTFAFDAPLGVLGRIVERTILTGYMTRLLTARNQVLKEIAESDEWQGFLPPG